MTGAASATPDDQRSVDAFLGGLVALVQPRKGHRAGLDAALLQALVPASAEGRAVDLGAGVGTVAFSIAARAKKLSVIGIERDSELVDCGLEALRRPENVGFASRVRLMVEDVGDRHALASELGDGDAAWVLMNPPFHSEGSGSQSPERRRRDAYVAREGLLASWLSTAATFLNPGGSLGLIHRADVLPDILRALAEDFGGVRIKPVHPFEDRAATRILVTAKRGSKAPSETLPRLVLHQEGGAWTPGADAILRGKAELAD